ncbi:MAG: hypothetical protein QOI61_162 [Actinomycetota bacterium]|jgi:quercetin dioxygenase-like cupin family protein
MEIVRRDGRERDAVRLFANDQFDAWLIGWPANHWTTPHDHGDSLGVVLVLDGLLVERAISAGGTHRLGAGDVTVIPAGAVHDVGTGDATALSLHLYSPPLAEMNFYD